MEPGQGTWRCAVQRKCKPMPPGDSHHFPLCRVPQFQTTTCGSRPAVAERRAHRGAAGQQQRRGRAGGELTFSSWTSAALCGPAVLRDIGERRHPPSPAGQALVALSPRCPRNCCLLIAWESHRQPATPTLALGQTWNGNSDSCEKLAWEMKHRRRHELLCQSQSRRGRGRQAHRQGRGHVPSGAGLCR